MYINLYVYKHKNISRKASIGIICMPIYPNSKYPKEDLNGEWQIGTFTGQEVYIV